MMMMVSRLLLPIGGVNVLLDWTFRLEFSFDGPILDPSMTTFVSFLKMIFQAFVDQYLV